MFQLCGQKQYSQAADFWVDGPETWRNDPGVARDAVDRVCRRQEVAGWKVVSSDVQDDAAFVQTQDWLEVDDPFNRSLEWQLVRRDDRWIVKRIK